MKDNLKAKLVLPVICICSAILLSVVNLITAPKISELENSLTISALNEVSQGYEFSEKKEVKDNSYVSYYYELNDNNMLKGYILGLKTSGYGGEMTLVASFDTNGKILAVKMLTDSETPGVGKKAENSDYMNMFIGSGTPENPVPLKKDMLNSNDQTVVSGATLTFTGISKSLKAASDFVTSL